MRRLLGALVCCGVAASANPALAFKSIEGCDMVAFASGAASVEIAPEAWRAYRDEALAILNAPPPPAQGPAGGPRAAANALIAAQQKLLAAVQDSEAYQEYLASDGCLVLSRLKPAAVEEMLGEIKLEGRAATTLREVTQAARAMFVSIEQRARFRSQKDKTLLAAQYYCFVAGTIAALLPPERQKTLKLGDFGATVGCKDAGRA